MPIVAQALKNLGTKEAFVVYGQKGIDEVSVEGKTFIIEVRNSEVLPVRKITPSCFGIQESSLKDIAPGKNAKENAEIILNVLGGKKSTKTDAVLINAALGIVAAGLTNNFKKATDIARESILSGDALKKLKLLIKLSNKK